ncbi:MAG: TusE/DsrC/DsvC family sulfur relay protein [Candidatus Bathyarchaeia archaeon]
METEVKNAIIDFIQSHYAKNKIAPSIRLIADKFKAQGVDRCTFYSYFPKGLSEACKAAGIPAPERLKQTQRALKVKKARSRVEGARVEEVSSTRLTLTEEQTRRLFGISHLEKGKDPSLIVDELLDGDSLLRKKYKLSLSDTKLIAKFLRAAVDRGWSTTSNPNIVDFITYLWNCGVQNLPAETVSGLVNLVNDLRARKWNPSEFVKEATDIHNAVYWYRQYKAGFISVEEFKQKVAFML